MSPRRRRRQVESVDLSAAIRELEAFVDSSCLSEKGRAGYDYCWQRFVVWCSERDVDSCPPQPQSVAAFVAWLACPLVGDDGAVIRSGLKASTLRTYVCAVRFHLQRAGVGTDAVDDSRVRAVVAGAVRVVAAPPAKKRPVTPEIMLKLLVPPAPTVFDLQERAALLLARELSQSWARVIRVRREDVTGDEAGYSVRLTAVVTEPRAVSGRLRVRDVDAFAAAMRSAGIRPYGSRGADASSLAGRPAAYPRGSLSELVTSVTKSFVHAVCTGAKGCRPELAAEIAAVMGRSVDKLFEPQPPSRPWVVAQECVLRLPHRHVELARELGVEFAEMACAACALADLVAASPSSQRWLFGWRLSPDGSVEMTDLGSLRAVRATAKSLQTRWSYPAERLGMSTSVVSDLASISSLDLWRLAMCASNAWLVWVRDRAFELVSWHGGFRSSEVRAFDCADVDVRRDEHGEAGALVFDLGQSKTDPEGEGARVGVVRAVDPSLCAVRALLSYVCAVNLRSGPLFVQLSGHSGSLRSARRRDGLGAELGRVDRGMVSGALDRLCDQAGLVRREWGSHSMRSGYVVTGLSDGATDVQLMAKTRHSSPDQIGNYANADRARGRSVARKLLS